MISVVERGERAAGRRLPGGLEGAIARMVAATDGAATTLTYAQVRVLTMLAYEVDTIRDLCAACGFRSTNAGADHMNRLELRKLIERTKPREGTAYRYAPWRLTSAGWRTLGPCTCIVDAVARGDMFVTRDRFNHVGGDSAEPAIAVGRVMLPPGPGNPLGHPLCYCPWCGWRLW